MRARRPRAIATGSSRRDAWVRFRGGRLALIGLLWLGLVLGAVVSADLWVPSTFADPLAVDTTPGANVRPPSIEHPFGTDRLGRDVFARVVYGARVSLSVGIIAVAISLVLGVALGSLAGYYGGAVDAVVMRSADVFFAFPAILFAIVFIAVVGPGYHTVFIAIGILGWPGVARLLRGSVLSVKREGYVDAARAMGASDWWIIRRHILPNAIAPVIAYAALGVGGAIIAEAALSFLGVGVQPPAPSWGLMLSEARSIMFVAPWLMVWPGFAITTTVLACVFVGDGLRDALDVRNGG